jgi:hypothetical protein
MNTQSNKEKIAELKEEYADYTAQLLRIKTA